MSKLKTLKDLIKGWGNRSNGFDFINPEELKAEAIKDLMNIYDLEDIFKIKLNDKIINILNKYIMWKNNITEEDLK